MDSKQNKLLKTEKKEEMLYDAYKSLIDISPWRIETISKAIGYANQSAMAAKLNRLTEIKSTDLDLLCLALLRLIVKNEEIFAELKSKMQVYEIKTIGDN